MAYSMTGFGKSQGTFLEMDVTVEIRSVNNRFQEISIKLPKLYQAYEFEARELIRKCIERGKISVFYQIVQRGDERQSIQINENAVKAYSAALQRVIDINGSQEQVSFRDLLQFDDIFIADDSDILQAEVVSFLNQLTEEALNRLNEMRRKEADSLLHDLKERNHKIKNYLLRISDANKIASQIELQRLSDRMKELIDHAKIDPQRLEMELALLSDKVDVSEECIRLESHLNQFDEEIELDKGIGKRLNFLLQEMHREINTIGSKSNQLEISRLVVNSKEEIERIREQVQNLE